MVDIADIIEIETLADGTLKVRSRERRDLEFKQVCDEAAFKKCLKTIAAFSNTAGGQIVFGVTDRNRQVCGIDRAQVPDPAVLDNIISQHLTPAPELEVEDAEIAGLHLVLVTVKKKALPPVLAIKDCQVMENGRNKPVLAQGAVYYRRAGQSLPATGEEFRAIMERRDDAVRNSILGLLSRAQEIGFERVAIADAHAFGKAGENATLYVPEEAAKSLNIIDRARLVEDKGAPAYEIKGSVSLTTHSDKDPRKPALPSTSVRALRPDIERTFWRGIPWSPAHLKKAAAHLGYWDNPNGDGRHTSCDELTKRIIYFEQGRIGIKEFFQREPDTFIDVVGSRHTKAEWVRRKAGED
jgi:Schlafen, AlbA_2